MSIMDLINTTLLKSGASGIAALKRRSRASKLKVPRKKPKLSAIDIARGITGESKEAVQRQREEQAAYSRSYFGNIIGATATPFEAVAGPDEYSYQRDRGAPVGALGVQNVSNTIADTLRGFERWAKDDPKEIKETYIALPIYPHGQELTAAVPPAEIPHFQVNTKIYNATKDLAHDLLEGKSIEGILNKPKKPKVTLAGIGAKFAGVEFEKGMSDEDKRFHVEELLARAILRDLYRRYSATQEFESSILGSLNEGLESDYISKLVIGDESEDQFVFDQILEIGKEQRKLDAEYMEHFGPIEGLVAHGQAFAWSIPQSAIAGGYILADMAEFEKKRTIARFNPGWSDLEIDEFYSKAEEKEGEMLSTTIKEVTGALNNEIKQVKQELIASAKQRGDNWKAHLFNDYLFPGMDAVSSMVPMFAIAYVSKNPWAAAGLLSTIENLPDYIDAREAGIDPTTALWNTGAKIFITSWLEKISLDWWFSATKIGRNFIVQVAGNIGMEAVTEGAQEFEQNVLSKISYDPDRDVLAGIKEAMIGAAIASGGMSFVMKDTTMQPPEIVNMENIYRGMLKKHGISEEDANIVIEMTKQLGEQKRAEIEQTYFQKLNKFAFLKQPSGQEFQKDTLLKQPGMEDLREGIEIPSAPKGAQTGAVVDFTYNLEKIPTIDGKPVNVEMMPTDAIYDPAFRVMEGVGDMAGNIAINIDDQFGNTKEFRAKVEEIKKSIEAGKPIQPILIRDAYNIFEDGAMHKYSVADGYHRLTALKELGVEEVGTIKISDIDQEAYLEAFPDDLAYEPEGIPKELAEEARKYKSAEEFVKAQGKPLYHGTPYEFDKFDINKAGTLKTSDWGNIGIYLDPTKNGANYYRREGAKRIDKEADRLYKAYEKKAKELGTRPMYESIDLGFDSAKYNELKKVENKWRKRLDEIDKDETQGRVMEIYIDPAAKVYRHYYEAGMITDQYLADIKKMEGYDVVEIWDRDSEGEVLSEVVVMNTNVIKTKSQLTDIWNKANKVQAPEKPLSIKEVGLKTVEGIEPEGISEIAYKATVKNGGVTINLKGAQPKKGYAYSPFKEVETKIPKDKFTKTDIDKFKKKYYDKLQEEGNHLGIWEEDGFIYIDISKVGPATQKTIDLAAKNKQLAVFDLETFETINTPYYEEVNRADKAKQKQQEPDGRDVEGVREVRKGEKEVTKEPWQMNRTEWRKAEAPDPIKWSKAPSAPVWDNTIEAEQKALNDFFGLFEDPIGEAQKGRLDPKSYLTDRQSDFAQETYPIQVRSKIKIAQKKFPIEDVREAIMQQRKLGFKEGDILKYLIENYVPNGKALITKGVVSKRAMDIYPDLGKGKAIVFEPSKLFDIVPEAKTLEQIRHEGKLDVRNFKQTEEFKEFAKFAETIQKKDIWPSIFKRHIMLMPQSVVERLDGRLVGPVYKAIIKPTNDAFVRKTEEEDYISKQVVEFKVIEGHTLDNETFDIGEAKIKGENEKAKALAEYMRYHYDEFIDRMNDVNRIRGKDLIPKRKDYMPHIQELTLVAEVLGGFGRVNRADSIKALKSRYVKEGMKPDIAFQKAKRVIEGGQGLEMYIDAANPVMPYLKHRLKEETNNRSAIGTFRSYVSLTLNYIYQGENIIKIKAYTDVLPLQSKLYLKQWNTEAIAGRMPDTLFRSKVVGKIAKKLKNRLGANIILGKLSVYAMQLMSMPQTATMSGPTNYAYGVMKRFEHYLSGKPGLFEFSEIKVTRSLQLDIGTGDTTFIDLVKLARKYEKLKNAAARSRVAAKFGKTLMHGLMETFDQFTVGAAFEAFYHQAINKEMSPGDAWEYALIMTGKTQANYYKQALSPFMRTNAGGFFAQFGIFGMAQIEFIRKDLGKTFIKEGKFTEAKKSPVKLMEDIVMIMALAFLTDWFGEELIGRPAFEFKPLVDAIVAGDWENVPERLGEFGFNYIPFAGSIKFGSAPPVVDFIWDVIQALGPVSPGDKAQAIDDLWNKWPWLIVPPAGGGQLKNMLEVTEAETGIDFPFIRDKTITKAGVKKFEIEGYLEKLKSFVFGLYATKAAQDYFEGTAKKKSTKGKIP